MCTAQGLAHNLARGYSTIVLRLVYSDDVDHVQPSSWLSLAPARALLPPSQRPAARGAAPRAWRHRALRHCVWRARVWRLACSSEQTRILFARARGKGRASRPARSAHAQRKCTQVSALCYTAAIRDMHSRARAVLAVRAYSTTASEASEPPHGTCRGTGPRVGERCGRKSHLETHFRVYRNRNS